MTTTFQLFSSTSLVEYSSVRVITSAGASGGSHMRNVCPSAFPPGHSACAADALITATCDSARASPASNPRPCAMVIPSVAKYSGDTCM